MDVLDANLELWGRCDKTPAQYTKQFRRAGGFAGTDISPQYRLKKLTELFGPVGLGWGYEILSRWRETFGGVDYVFVEIRLWYKANGTAEECYTGPQIGGTMADRTPDESYKMSITDAIGKCAAQLGVGADVYLGEFDSSKYRESTVSTMLSNAPQIDLNAQIATKTKATPNDVAAIDPNLLESKKIIFGKFKGASFGEIGTIQLQSYLDWCVGNPTPGFGMKDFIAEAQVVLEHRKKQKSG